MHLRAVIFILLASLLPLPLSFFAQADQQVPPGYFYQEDIYEVSPGREIFARVYRGNKNLPAVVLLNGLTQDTEHWNKALPELLKSGATVILYDMFHQGRTLGHFLESRNILSKIGTRPILPPLLAEKNGVGHLEPLLPAATIEQQAADLKSLVRRLELNKVMVVGLSYGGALALQYAVLDPDRVFKVVAMAPYVEPLAEQDQLIKGMVRTYKQTFPFARHNDVDLYDFFLRGLILSTYHLSEPTILKWGLMQPYANSELARGIRHMPSLELAEQLRPSVLHLGIAGADGYIPRSTLFGFWQKVPREVRASLTVFEGVEHKINESVGPFMGAWLATLVQGRGGFSEGRQWQAFPGKGLMVEVGGRQGRLELPRTFACENFLLSPEGPFEKNLAIDRIARHPAEIMVRSFLSSKPAPMRQMSERVLKFWGML
ncbi:MAG: alpha/beta fold hydrolase [Bdellovibrionales bacterium]